MKKAKKIAALLAAREQPAWQNLDQHFSHTRPGLYTHPNQAETSKIEYPW